MATLKGELEAQLCWRPIKETKITKKSLYMVHEEFQDIDAKNKALTKRVIDVIAFAKQQVPFYQKSYEGIDFMLKENASLDDLQRLPLLSKKNIQDNFVGLTPNITLLGQQYTSDRLSSGSTGRPVRVKHSQASEIIFVLTKQREYRWFDFDPMKKLAVLRLPSQMPLIKDKELGLDETLRRSHWPSVGQVFHTAPSIGYSVFNEIEKQLEWLKKEDPNYLMAYAETLEHLAFASDDDWSKSSLESLYSISETLTQDMRNRIHSKFSVPIQQNYGLNEMGIVAVRCPEGGRYHVHSEFYYVEIVDDKGQHCDVGEIGRILVTSLGNAAMPLLRYDTDDMAVVTDQKCPCGRTLPSFGAVIGRYSRIAFLPKTTLPQVGVLRQALENIPSRLVAPLRKFQIVHRRNGNFELRVLGEGNFTAEFFSYFIHYWQQALGADAPQLSVDVVAQLRSGANGKFQDFISEYMPDFEKFAGETSV